MEDEKTAIKVEGCHIKDCELRFGPGAHAFPNFIPNTAELSASFRNLAGAAVVPDFHHQGDPLDKAEPADRRRMEMQVVGWHIDTGDDAAWFELFDSQDGPTVGPEAATYQTPRAVVYLVDALAAVAAERDRIKALVEAVRDANRDAEDADMFRLLKPGQERAWAALLAGLEGPNVQDERTEARPVAK